MIEVSQVFVLIGFGVTIVFNAGIQWAFISVLRKDMNGFKSYLHEHEEWAHLQVKEFSERVSNLEGRAGR